jgi:hypothetical protein
MKGLGSLNFARENARVRGADPPPHDQPVIPMLHALVTAPSSASASVKAATHACWPMRTTARIGRGGAVNTELVDETSHRRGAADVLVTPLGVGARTLEGGGAE